MCDCLSFLTAPWRRVCQHFSLCWSRRRLWQLLLPSEHVQVFNAVSSGNVSRHLLTECMPASNGFKAEDMSIMKPEYRAGRDVLSKSTGYKFITKGLRCSWRGSNSIASLFTKRGRKGVNQDAMILVEDFASQAGTVFCGVFDGHGPHGHLVAKYVGDILPQKLASCWESWNRQFERKSSSSASVKQDVSRDDLVRAWKDSLVQAYKLMDAELLVNDHLDSVSSGTTAVTLVKQGLDVILGNVGDSRAILGSSSEDGSLVAVQLTADLKPDVPGEAARIRCRKGRVFALESEPSVKRVWLPHMNAPGLAMTRALGDYCLKNHGVICEPVVTHRQLSPKDKFIVLATDGIWDVLSNKRVVETVALTPEGGSAAKAVVDAAVHAWRSDYSTSKVDDCAVICLFLDNLGSTS